MEMEMMMMIMTIMLIGLFWVFGFWVGWDERGGRGLEQALERLGFFQTIPRRLIASVDLYFHFFGLCLVLRQNSLSLHVM